MVIKQEDLKKREELMSEIDKIDANIETHITNCLHEIFNIFGGVIDTWYYPDTPEGGMGTFKICYDVINIITECKKDTFEEPLYEGGNPCCNFPEKFLFMTVSEVRDAVQADYDKTVAKEMAKKLKAKKKKDAKKKKKLNAIEAARKKLTAEEIKALNL